MPPTDFPVAPRSPFGSPGDAGPAATSASGASGVPGVPGPPPVAAGKGPSRRRGRRLLAGLACVVVGAVVAVLVYAWVDSSSGGGSAAAPSSAPTSTTSAVPNAAIVYRKIQPSLVLIETGTDATADLATLGSGVIIDAEGDILTADHVVDGASRIVVTFGDGTQTTATVASASPENDTAVLTPEQPPSVIVPAVLGGGVHVGDPTFSVGNPLGLTDSISQGVISGLDRSLTREDGNGEIKGLIQFDAAVNPGSSGGPLLDRKGQVVGIVTALANPTNERFFVGIGFAVPIATAGGGAHVPPG